MNTKVKIPLEMANGTMVRSIEGLRENFDIKKVIGYFFDGRLHKWLEDRYYDEELDALSELDEKDPELANKLCKIFGVDITETYKIDTKEIREEQEKTEKLKLLTDDDSLISKATFTAFNQDDLENLYKKDVDTIYLCEGVFDIPENKRNIKYILIGEPVVTGLKFDVYIDNNHLYINKGYGTELIDDEVCAFTFDADFVYYIKFEESKKCAIKKFNIVLLKAETIFVDENYEISAKVKYCTFSNIHIHMKCHNDYLFFNTTTNLYSCAINGGKLKEITDKYIVKHNYKINDNKIYFIRNEQIVCIDLKTGEYNKCDKTEFYDETENNNEKYRLVLTEKVKSPLKVIKIIRENSSLGLAECKLIVDNVPQTIMSGITLEKAKCIAELLKRVDAEVCIEKMGLKIPFDRIKIFTGRK